MSLLSEINEKLTHEQQDAVKAHDGYNLIVAVPGSGKTMCISYSIAYLVDQVGVSPKNILLLTFTNAAAKHMLKRVSDLAGDDVAKKITAGTFHSVCSRLIRMNHEILGIDPKFTILDESDSKKIWRELLKIYVPVTMEPDPFKYSVHSFRRVTGLDLEHVWARMEIEFPHDIQTAYQVFAKMIEEYEFYKKEANAVDFDDLELIMVDLFRDVPVFREAIKRRFKYVIVDEAQDTNRVEFEIIKTISEYHKNLKIIGDDGQSIYRFRCAEVKNIKNFTTDFNAKRFFLSYNFRSLDYINQISIDVIKTYPRAFIEKPFRTFRSDTVPGRKATLYYAGITSQLYCDIVEMARQFIRDGVKPNQIAVVYRLNAMSEIQNNFIEAGIKCTVKGGLAFLERAHVKDMMAFLRVIFNPKDKLSWKRVLGMLPGIGSKTCLKIIDSMSMGATLNNALLGCKGKQRDTIKDLFEIITKVMDGLNASHFSSGIDTLASKFFTTYLIEHQKNVGEADSKISDCRTLYLMSKNFDTFDEFMIDIQLKVDDNEDDENSVTLTTVHKAKGLEWKVVFLMGLHQGTFPFFRTLTDPDDFEDETRLYYVAVSRAMDHLIVCNSVKEFRYGETKETTMSEFINPNLFQCVWNNGISIREGSFDEMQYWISQSKSSGNYKGFGFNRGTGSKLNF